MIRKHIDVTIVGLGYVGLSTAVCFASRGLKVLGVDVDREKIEKLSARIPTIHEPMLKEMLSSCMDSNKLAFSTKLEDGCKESRLVFLTVGTPSKPDGSMNEYFITEALRQVGESTKDTKFFQTIVIKSTVLPGTTSDLLLPLLERTSGKRVGESIGLCVNPEFLREGSAINDTFNPDAIILGCEDARSSDEMLRFYKKFYDTMPETFITSYSNAEMIKYAVNAFRGVQLSFLNSLASLASRVKNCDVGEVINAFSRITKVDNRYLRPGPGFGGSCLPKDMKALIHLMNRLSIEPDLIEAALKVNNLQPKQIASFAERILGSLSGKRISVLGLAYKGGTDDTRDSPSILIIKELLAKKGIVTAFDPAANKNAMQLLGNKIRYADSIEECIKGSDLAIIATDWIEFKDITPDTFKVNMREPIVIDARRILDHQKFIHAGIKFFRLGSSIDLNRRKKM